jgi:asparagine synthetase B (glutamine-hydrolysing)
LTIPEKIIFDKKTTKPLLKHVANKHIPQKIYSRTKQGFRAPVGEWIKKDQEYFYDSIRSFNSSTNLFKSKSLEKIISGRDYQKKWYLSNLAKWHLSRSLG